MDKKHKTYFEKLKPTKENCFFLREVLDDLQSDDFFGTEGQCDPRGDFRDEGEYEGNLWEVNEENFHKIIENILKMDSYDIEIIYELMS